MNLRFFRDYGWIVLGCLAASIKLLSAGQPELVERYYSRGVFLGIRYAIDYGLGWIPFPTLYLFVLLLLFFTVRAILRWRQHYQAGTLSFSRGLRHFTSFFAALVFFFFFLWGYNYDRLPIEDQLSLKISPVKLREIKKELEEETKRIIELRALIPDLSDSVAIERRHFPSPLEQELRKELRQLLRESDLPATGRVRGRLLYPKGIFLRFSTAGLYFPFTGEGHVDPGLHVVQWPYVMTHELAHGYGIADEGSCNFLAYLACSRSAHPAIAYAGHLNYWRTVAINYLRYEPEVYEEFRKTLPAGIRADLDAINSSMQRYPDLIPHLQYRVYDAYLKSQGIPEGMLNYNRVIMLVRAWRETHRS